MRGSLALQAAATGALRLDRAAAAAITLLALAVYLNGAFFSSLSALHVDLSINLTAAHALRDGENPYGETTLLARARELGSPPVLGAPEPFIYQSLFTSYIQPPPSALSVMPLTLLPWREATRAYLVLNNLVLAGAAALTLYTVRPTIPLRWAVAGAAVIVAGFSQLYGSFALGQVDATITFLLALGLWGYSRDKPAVTGTAIALGAAIKLVPATLLLYFLWKRDLRTVAWGLGTGAALFLVTLPMAGVDTYWTYFSEIVPGLLKGSTHYSNIAIGGAFNRLFVPETGGLGKLISLDEVPFRLAGRALTALTVAAVVAATATVIGRRSLKREVGVLPGKEPPPFDGPFDKLRTQLRTQQGYVLEYYLVVAVTLLVSSVTWEFYVVWLIPLFLAVFLAPSRVLPGRPADRVVLLAAFALAYVGLNYPGDHYLFDVNAFFYHPDWVPGIVVEDIVNLYPLPPGTGAHLAVVPLLRLTTLSFLALTLALSVRDLRRAQERAEVVGCSGDLEVARGRGGEAASGHGTETRAAPHSPRMEA